MSTTAREREQVIARLITAGIACEDARQLRRISMTLQRWFELECGDGNDYASWSIERDEATDKPYYVTYPHSGASYRHRVADREAGAKKRLYALCKQYPAYQPYIQTDPRGCALYLVPKADLQGTDIEQVYHQGIAVY